MQFPVGIDSERFIRALENPQVQNCIKKLKEKISGKKVSLLSPSHSFLLTCHSRAFVVPIAKLEYYRVDDFKSN